MSCTRCILPGSASCQKKLGTSRGTLRRCFSTSSTGRPGTFGLAVRAADAKEVKVCTKKECKRMGSLKTLAKFEALLESKEGLGEMEVKTVNCLGECGMGPNVQINGADGPIINGVKSEEDVAKVVDRLLDGE